MLYSEIPLEPESPKSDRAAAREFCCRARLKRPALELLEHNPAIAPAAFFEVLVEKEYLTDAIRVLAHRLPKRDAVWWGCLCGEHANEASRDEAERQALAAAVRWVLDPTDENRRMAGKWGKKARMKTSGGALAMAVFLSGGSVSLPGLPFVPPKPQTCAAAVAGSILLLAARHDRHRARQKWRRDFLDLGRQILRGENLWFDANQPRARVVEALAEARR